MNGVVIFVNPYNGNIESMPVEMVNAYVPFASQLRLEEAAKLAHMRDVDASINLLLSMDVIHTEYQAPTPLPR